MTELDIAAIALVPLPEVIKHVCAVPPHVDRPILAEALIIKPIDLSDLSAFMVPSNECYPVRVPDLHHNAHSTC